MKALDIVRNHNSLVERMLVVGKNDKAIEAACTVVKYIFEDAPALGLDLDGTISESPEFFKILSMVWPGAVIIITYRTDKDKAIEDAKGFGIHFNDLVVVDRLDGKAKVIKDHNIKVYIDDQDECIVNIPDDVTVLKIRNEGNFKDGKWLYSNLTGIILRDKDRHT